MEQKNNTVLFSIGGALVGVFLGWLIWGGTMMPQGMHRMPGGSMMTDDMMHQGMSMDQMMDAMSASLAGKTGDAFDKAFLEEMIPHHQGAIVMARLVLATSKRPELITLANEIIAAQQKEIDMMQQWQSEWFNQ
jgi:uncharacterized protein (DUF305 family)